MSFFVFAVSVLALCVGTHCFSLVCRDNSTFAVDVAEWNGAANEGGSPLPICIYFVKSEADTVAAVKNALSRNLRLVVRSGRHQYTGYTVGHSSLDAERFAVIDVSNLTHIKPAGANGINLFSVGAGVRQFDLYNALMQKGLLLPGGTCPTVGIAGFLLGGGYGFFGRKFSVGADSVVGGRILTIDKNRNVAIRTVVSQSTSSLSKVFQWNPFNGRKKAVNGRRAAENDALLWAMRGGGNNNLGAVLSFLFQAHVAPPTYSRIRITFNNVTICQNYVQSLYDSIAPHAANDVYIQLVIYQRSCAIFAVVEGDEKHLNSSAQVNRWLSLPSSSSSGPVTTSYSTLVTTLSGCSNVSQCLRRVATAYPNPNKPARFGAMSLYADVALGVDGLTLLYDAFGQKPSSVGFVFAEFDPYGPQGAVNHKATNETAFPHRQSLYHIQLMGYWSNSSADIAAQQWLNQTFHSLAKFGGGSYRNYPATWLPSASSRYYRGNLDALKKVKSTIDPLGVFVSSL